MPKRTIFIVIALVLIVSGGAFLVTRSVSNKVSEPENTVQAKQSKTEGKTSDKCKATYAVTDIAEGEEIRTEALEEREIDADKMPEDALVSSSLAAGRVAKYEIKSGHMLSFHDLVQFDAKTLKRLNKKKGAGGKG